MGYSTSSPELKPTLTDVFNQSHSYLPKRVPFNPSPSLGELMKRDLKWKPLFVPVIQGFWSYTRSKHSSHIIIKAHTTRAEACFFPKYLYQIWETFANRHWQAYQLPPTRYMMIFSKGNLCYSVIFIPSIAPSHVLFLTPDLSITGTCLQVSCDTVHVDQRSKKDQ